MGDLQAEVLTSVSSYAERKQSSSSSSPHGRRVASGVPHATQGGARGKRGRQAVSALAGDTAELESVAPLRGAQSDLTVTCSKRTDAHGPAFQPCGTLGCDKCHGHLGLCSSQILPPRRNRSFHVPPGKNDPASPGGTSYRHAANLTSWHPTHGARVRHLSKPSRGSCAFHVYGVDLFAYHPALMSSPVEFHRGSPVSTYVDLVRLMILMSFHVLHYEADREPYAQNRGMTMHEVSVIWQLCYLANITWSELYDYFVEFWQETKDYMRQIRHFNLPTRETEYSARTNYIECPTIHADLHPELRWRADMISAKLAVIEEVFLLQRIWHYQLPCPRLLQRVWTSSRHAVPRNRPQPYSWPHNTTPRGRRFAQFISGLDAGIRLPPPINGPAFVIDPPFEPVNQPDPVEEVN